MRRQLFYESFFGNAQYSPRQAAIEGELTSFFRGRKLDYSFFSSGTQTGVQLFFRGPQSG